jgi:hydrogenase maturation protease
LLSIIGCGNSNRSDDGAGVYVVAQLKLLLGDTHNEDIRIFDAGTAGMEVMFQAKGSDALIIIDANSSNSEPGAIFEVPGEILETCPEPQYNLHDFRWNHAIYAGKKIFREDFPKEITVYLIEAENLSLGLEMSDKIKDAADKVVQNIIAKLKKQTVSVRNGNLYIGHEVCQKFFPGIETIALLKREPGFLVMPVFSQSSGGRLLKLRNSKGDRVVTATDFLHDLGINYEQEQSFKATWESESAALVVDLTNAKKCTD